MRITKEIALTLETPQTVAVPNDAAVLGAFARDGKVYVIASYEEGQPDEPRRFAVLQTGEKWSGEGVHYGSVQLPDGNRHVFMLD